MNRRAFLRTLAAGLSAAAIDPEQLLRVPAAKPMLIPPAPIWPGNSGVAIARYYQRREMEWDADLALSDWRYMVRLISAVPFTDPHLPASRLPA